MAPKPHPFPGRDELLTLAPHHESLASLARAIGWLPNSFTVRLEREGWREDVDQALTRGAGKEDAIAAALKGVAGLVR